MPNRPGPVPDLDDEPTDLTEPARHDLVAEAVVIFGEDAARDLAVLLCVPFEAVAVEGQP